MDTLEMFGTSRLGLFCSGLHRNSDIDDYTPTQPAPKDHPWRTMKNPLGGGNGMVPHYSGSCLPSLLSQTFLIHISPNTGTTLDAQARYAAGVQQILSNFFTGAPQDPQNLIVHGGDYATKNCKSDYFLCRVVLSLTVYHRRCA
jgi:hypothetical protein